jgi:MFS family permease
MSVFGISDTLFSYVFGKVADYPVFGHRFVLVLGLLTHFLCFIFFIIAFWTNSDLIQSSVSDSIFSLWTFFGLAILFGLGDGCVNTSIYAVFGSVFANTEAAFANLKLFQSFATALAFACRSSLSLLEKTLFVCSSDLCSFLLLPVISRRVPSIELQIRHN